MKLKTFILIGGSLLLTACGGGGGSSSTHNTGNTNLTYPPSASTTADYGSTGTMTIGFQVNAGSDPVGIGNLSISGTNASSFSTSSAGCGDVLPGETCNIQVVYHAPAAGGTPLTATAKLNFTVNDVKSGETLSHVYPAVTLSGSVNHGELSVTPVNSTVVSNRDVTMTFTVSSSGQKQEAKIVQVGGKAISGLGNSSCSGLNYKGGSFPGTGGTCTLNSDISSCTLVLSVPATTNTCSLSGVNLNYDGGSGDTTASIGGSVTRKNIVFIGDNSGVLSYVNVGDFGVGDFTTFTPSGITGQITALAAGKDANGGEVFAVASSGKVLIDRYNTTQAFNASSWTNTRFPTTGVQQLAIQKGVATNNQYLFARTSSGIYFYNYAASSPSWTSFTPSGAATLTGMAVATGRGSQTVIMLLGTVGSAPTVWYQTVAQGGGTPSSSWTAITPSGTSLVLNNLSESGGFFQLSGSVSGTATIFVVPSTSPTFASGSWKSHAVDAQTAGAVASYYNFLNDGSGTSVVANYSGSNVAKTYYGTSADPSTGTISYTDVTPSGLAAGDKIATIVGAYLTGTTTGSAERRIVALKTTSSGTEEFYWSWFGANPISWTDGVSVAAGQTTLPNAVAVTNTGLFP